MEARFVVLEGDERGVVGGAGGEANNDMVRVCRGRCRGGAWRTPPRWETETDTDCDTVDAGVEVPDGIGYNELRREP